MAAYPLARYTFKAREFIYVIFTTGLMFPLTVAILPLYLMIHDMGLVGNYFGLVLPQVAFALPITVIIMRPFIAALPKELEEAAFIDGVTRIGYFWRILLPLARPGMITVGETWSSSGRETVSLRNSPVPITRITAASTHIASALSPTILFAVMTTNGPVMDPIE